MNRKEAERLARQRDTLVSLGFTHEEAESLRRISMTLQRWHELECGDGHGVVERDEQTQRPYWISSDAPDARRIYIPDRERGALKRLAAIVARRNAAADRMGKGLVQPFVQGDPRGAALYILRPGDVPEGEDASAFYNRGVCVY